MHLDYSAASAEDGAVLWWRRRMRRKHFFPQKFYLSMWRKRYHVCATQSLSISMGIRMASSSGTLNGGKDGPWVKRNSLELGQCGGGGIYIQEGVEGP